MGSLKSDERKTQQHTQTWSTKHNKDNRRDRSRATTGERERERERKAGSFLPFLRRPAALRASCKDARRRLRGPCCLPVFYAAAHRLPPNNELHKQRARSSSVFCFFWEFLFVAKLEIIHRNLEECRESGNRP